MNLPAPWGGVFLISLVTLGIFIGIIVETVRSGGHCPHCERRLK